ncbi:MAG TPA: DUF3566 domain-containing protein [Acidimicrobiales bacterium]|nr:DUF3566 domain-containing protein [Acidimicrobiales bacterium]
MGLTLADRRGRTVIRRVDVASVARVSGLFYLCVSAILLGLAVVAWAAASVAGLVGGMERFIKSLFGFSSFHFASLRLFLGAMVTAVVLSALGTLVNVVAALAYNFVARTWGGIEVSLGGAEAPLPVAPAVRRPVI